VPIRIGSQQARPTPFNFPTERAYEPLFRTPHLEDHPRRDRRRRPDVRIDPRRRPEHARRAARVGDPGREPDRTAAQVQAARRLPVEADRPEGRVHPGDGLRGVGRRPDQQEDRHGLVRRLHLRAGQRAQQGHDHAAGAARRRRKIPLGVRHHPQGHQQAGRPEGQDAVVRFGVVDLGPPDAALLPAGRENQSGHRPETHRVLGRARRDGRLGRRRQGRCGCAEHFGVGETGGRAQGRSVGGARVLHHAWLLRLQLERALGHEPGAEEEAHRRLPRAGQVHA
jgi:hypothetical protein